MSTGPPPPDPIVGFIQMLSLLSSSIRRPEEPQSPQFPSWYLTLRSFMDSLMTQPTATSGPSIQRIIDSARPFLTSLLGANEAEIDAVLRNLSRLPPARPPSPPLTEWTPEVAAHFQERYPEAMAQYEQALAEETEKACDEPAEKRARHE